MKLSRTIALLTLFCASLAFGQGWREAYEEALGHVREERWLDARIAFQRAAALRPDDFAGRSMLPGSVTEPTVWRDGAAYSPNFGAAVAGFRAALLAAQDESRVQLLRDVAREFETLLEKGQRSKEAIYFLGVTFDTLRDTQAQQRLEARLQSGEAPTWRVDAALITPEETAAIGTMSFVPSTSAPPEAASQNPPPAEATPATDLPRPATQPRRNPADPGPPPVRVDPTRPDAPVVSPGGDPQPAGNGLLGVASVPTKFALVVANTTSLLPDGEVPFAGADAHLIRDRLTQVAGYPTENVDVLLDATATEILDSANRLAARMPEDATLLLFFTGVGVNLDGRDFLAGVDTQSATDSSTMIAKTDVYRLFMAKGARIFAFFQTHRPIIDGRYFGQEVPIVGAIAQMQATAPGDRIFSLTRGGQTNGLFAHAMGTVLSDFRSNRVPILEFGWQVFFAIRRGGTTGTGLGSLQTPTLPVITNMGADARF